MSEQNIILTGFMGTGKSSLGRMLARRLDYRFIDTDTEIERRKGCTVADIFREEGEPAFRALETELVRELSQHQRLVIATGGGLVMNPTNVELLKAGGIIICLTAEPEEILARISRQKQVRPLLQETNPDAKIAQLLAQRAPVYAQFRQLATSGQSHEELIAQLLDIATSH
jgi:shikimate kinase